jgi:protein involved in polysaccharide export with SLBB domain
MNRVLNMLNCKLWGVAFASVLILLTGCFTGSGTGGEYTVDNEVAPPLGLSVGEKVTIRFAGIPTPPPPHEERIRDDGTIHPPYLNQPVKAEGLTPPQLQRKLQEAYVPRIFSTLSITVITEDRLFTINGEVVRSGRYPYVGETTAVEAISQAGGLTDYAKKRKITVIRGNGSQISFDYEKARRDSRFDPPIYPKDIIDVPRRLY